MAISRLSCRTPFISAMNRVSFARDDFQQRIEHKIRLYSRPASRGTHAHQSSSLL
jgi:hypothetical protein